MTELRLSSIKTGADIGHYLSLGTDRRTMGLGSAIVCICGAFRPHISTVTFKGHSVYKGKVDLISVGTIPESRISRIVFEHDRPDRFFIEVAQDKWNHLSRLHIAFDNLSQDSFVIKGETRHRANQYLFLFEGDRNENLFSILDIFRKII